MQEFVREMDRSFQINRDAVVELNNQYGAITINTWDKDQVDIKIVVTVEAKNKDNAEDVFDRIDIKFNSTPEFVMAKTIIKNKEKAWWHEWIGGTSESGNYEIDYLVYMPANAQLSLNLKHGDAYVGSLQSDIAINVKYGTLKCEDQQYVVMNLGHGKATLGEIDRLSAEVSHAVVKGEEIDEMVLVAAYSEFDIEECNNLNLKSKHCKYRIESVNELVNSIGKYDDFVIDFIDEIHMNTQFTDLKVGQLKDVCNLTFNYGSVKINQIDDDFEAIEVKGQYTDFEMAIDDDSSFKMLAKSNFGDIDCFSGIEWMNHKGTDYSKELTGYYQDKNSNQYISVNINYGSFELSRY